MIASPSLLVVFWLPGAGKSTVARMAYECLWSARSVLLCTDVVRKELFPVSVYSREESDRVYAEFFRRAEASILDGKHVILDAVFSKRSERDRAVSIAHTQGVPHRLIHVSASEKAIKDRLERRINDPSEADFQTYLFLKCHFEPVSEDHVAIDNSGDRSTLFESVKVSVFSHATILSSFSLLCDHHRDF